MARGGALARDLSGKLMNAVMPGVEGAEMSKARFRRTGEPDRERRLLTREGRPFVASGDSRAVTCPYGEFDAGGFCFPFDACD